MLGLGDEVEKRVREAEETLVGERGQEIADRAEGVTRMRNQILEMEEKGLVSDEELGQTWIELGDEAMKISEDIASS